MNDISFVAGGPAGAGVITIGETIGKVFQRLGWHVFIYDDYQSIIKGGHNAIYVRAAREPISSQLSKVDVIIALDKLSIDTHINELNENGIVIYNSKAVPEFNYPVKGIGIDFEKIVLEAGNARFFNTVAIGSALSTCDSEGVSLKQLDSIFQERFGSKGQDIVQANTKAAKAGFDAARELEKDLKPGTLVAQDQNKRLLIHGNDSVTMGAVKAGVKVHCQYPMTPASTILGTMAAIAEKKGIVVRQPEDELAAMNMAIGASVSGARAMTATSGGGYCLKVEAIGFAAMAEVPVVVVESQRAGPSTGLPTYTEQADLKFILNSSQGDFPRVVVAPGDIEECFYMTFEAFNLADLIQSPVQIVVDKYLSSSYQTVPYFDTTKLKINRGKLMDSKTMESSKDYKRYEFTEDGASPRAIPSQPNGMHVASSYEHDEYSVSDEDPANKTRMTDKRMKKLELISESILGPKVHGEKGAEIAIVCWGSTKMPALEALKLLSKQGIKVNVVQFTYILPFPVAAAKKILSSYKLLIDVEGNSTAQLRGVIREHSGILIEKTFLKYDGRPFHPEEIAGAVEKFVKSNSKR